MTATERFIRCLTRAAVAGCAALVVVAGPAAAQGPAPQAVHIGIVARKAPPPPTFSFDAVPEDEGFAGARVAIKENDTTGAFTGQRYMLDETILDDDDSPVAAVRKLVEAGAGLVLANLPADELVAVADALSDRDAVLFNIGA